MNRSRKDMTLMCVVGALLLFAAYNFLFKPQRASLSTARDDRANIEQQISEAELALQAPLVEPSDVHDDGAAAAVPDHPELSDLLRQLQATADASGVALVSVDPAALDLNPAGAGGSVQVNISASGPAASVVDYLERLRDMKRQLVVEQVSIDTPLDQPTQLKLAARVFTREEPAGNVSLGPSGPSAAQGS